MNNITVIRKIDGYTIKALATYIPSVDGWEIRVESHYGYERIMDPNEVWIDVWRSLGDIVNEALAEDRSKQAILDGPYSSSGRNT